MAGATGSPLIVNNTNYPIIVYEERGVLYNKQALNPNEAVSITYSGTGAFPYSIHAKIGSKESLPGTWESFKAFAGAAAIPTAFIGVTLATVVTCGALAGPALALAPLVDGLVVGGFVIDAAAVGAGIAAAGGAQVVAEKLVEKYPERFGTYTPHYVPGERIVAVRGGIAEGPMTLVDISREEYEALNVTVVKDPVP